MATVDDANEMPFTRPLTAAKAEWVILLAACAWVCLLLWDKPDILISSDTLFPADFTWDLLHHPGTWASFELPHVPGFFPDLLIYGTAQLVTGSWRAAMAIWTLVSVAWLVIAACWIAARVAGAGGKGATAAVLSVIVPLLTVAILDVPGPAIRPTVALDGGGSFFPWVFILLPFTHGGLLLLTVTGAAAAGPGSRLSMGSKTVVLTLICFAACLSDLLSVAFLLIPLTIAILCQIWAGVLDRWPPGRVFAGAWSGGVLGMVCAKALDRQIMLYPSLAEIPGHVGHCLRDLPHQPGMLIAVIAGGALVARTWRRHGTRGCLADFWPVFAAAAGAGSLLLTMLLYEDIGSYRYAMPFLWWTAIFACGWLADVVRWRFTRPAVALAACVAVAGWSAVSGTPRLARWNMPLASCLLDSGLRTGLADFWWARSTRAASDWRLQIAQIDDFGEARVWGSNRWWYTHDMQDETRRPAFRFIIMERLPRDRIAAVYGLPDHVKMCGTTTLWVYDDPARVFRDLAGASPFLADMFATAPEDRVPPR